MFDWFEASHPIIRVDLKRIRLQPQIYQHALQLCQDPDPPRLSVQLASLSPGVEYLERYILAHLAIYLVKQNLFDVPRLERMVLETVILHRLASITHAWSPEEKAKAGRVTAVIGCLVQARLTELLLSIDPDDRVALFALGEKEGFNRELWRIMHFGARAVARTMISFSQVDGITMRLPTLEEDIDRGVDLFVEVTPSVHNPSDNPFYLAVSVKSVDLRISIAAECATDTIHAVVDPIDRDQLQKIINGSSALHGRYIKKFYPVRVQVGHESTTAAETQSGLPSGRMALERLLANIEQQVISFQQRHALSANSDCA